MRPSYRRLLRDSSQEISRKITFWKHYVNVSTLFLSSFSSFIPLRTLPTEKRPCIAWYPTLFQKKRRLNLVQICIFQTFVVLGHRSCIFAEKSQGFIILVHIDGDLGEVEVEKMLITKGPWPECLNQRCLFKHRKIYSRSSDQTQRSDEDKRPQINISHGGQCVEKKNQSNN